MPWLAQGIWTYWEPGLAPGYLWVMGDRGQAGSPRPRVQGPPGTESRNTGVPGVPPVAVMAAPTMQQIGLKFGQKLELRPLPLKHDQMKDWNYHAKDKILVMAGSSKYHSEWIKSLHAENAQTPWEPPYDQYTDTEQAAFHEFNRIMGYAAWECLTGLIQAHIKVEGNGGCTIRLGGWYRNFVDLVEQDRVRHGDGQLLWCHMLAYIASTAIEAKISAATIFYSGIPFRQNDVIGYMDELRRYGKLAEVPEHLWMIQVQKHLEHNVKYSTLWTAWDVMKPNAADKTYESLYNHFMHHQANRHHVVPDIRRAGYGKGAAILETLEARHDPYADANPGLAPGLAIADYNYSGIDPVPGLPLHGGGYDAYATAGLEQDEYSDRIQAPLSLRDMYVILDAKVDVPEDDMWDDSRDVWASFRDWIKNSPQDMNLAMAVRSKGRYGSKGKGGKRKGKGRKGGSGGYKGKGPSRFGSGTYGKGYAVDQVSADEWRDELLANYNGNSDHWLDNVLWDPDESCWTYDYHGRVYNMICAAAKRKGGKGDGRAKTAKEILAGRKVITPQEDRERNGPCFKLRDEGVCLFGDKCKFSHMNLGGTGAAVDGHGGLGKGNWQPGNQLALQGAHGAQAMGASAMDATGVGVTNVSIPTAALHAGIARYVASGSNPYGNANAIQPMHAQHLQQTNAGLVSRPGRPGNE